jgi:hypothetical protein
VSYLLDEAGLNPLVRDDYGRTPLHDACWRAMPDFGMVEMLLRAESRLALVRDVRGHMPFEYARKGHRGAWRAFLDERRDLFVCPRLVLPAAPPTDPVPSPGRGRLVAASPAHSPSYR